jgi:hypothetical protein
MDGRRAVLGIRASATRRASVATRELERLRRGLPSHDRLRHGGEEGRGKGKGEEIVADAQGRHGGERGGGWWQLGRRVEMGQKASRAGGSANLRKELEVL